jgi:NADH-quinone oxidoreductase subunit G
MFAGNTIELCPVGALTSRQYRFKARPWDLVRTPSICNGCAVGCNIEVHSRTETVLRLVSRANPAIDEGWLCDRGRFGTLPSPQSCRPTRPMLRRDGALAEATWHAALGRAAELLAARGGVLASPGLSNEAFWLLQRLAQRLPAALWPPASLKESWPVEGKIANLARCKSIVLVGIAVWTDLPILALWIRKAVLRGAKLAVLGDRNGLWRNTTTWLKGDPLAHVTEIANAFKGDGPAALLVHPSQVTRGRGQLQALATALGAAADTGVVGAPALGANARGALEMAPDVARGDADRVLTSKAVLAIGDEAWADLEAGSFPRLVLATSGPLPDDERIDVVLPMAHAYERQATIINLEGRVQRQEGGASPPRYARTDWGIIADLAQHLALGGPAPDDLSTIRSFIADEHPSLADVLHEEALIARV